MPKPRFANGRNWRKRSSEARSKKGHRLWYDPDDGYEYEKCPHGDTYHQINSRRDAYRDLDPDTGIPVSGTRGEWRPLALGIDRASLDPMMAAEFQPGARVRLKSVSHVLTLRSDRGTIVRPDDLDYYLVRLDRPALYRCGDEEEELDEIIEDADNMELLEGAPQPAGSR